MALTTFTNGTTADADEVNDNFSIVQNKITYDTYYDPSPGSTTSTTYVDKGTITTPEALEDGQKVLIEADVYTEDASFNTVWARLYDDTGSSEIAEMSFGGSTVTSTGFLAGEVTIASSGGTKDIKLQYKTSNGSYAAAIHAYKIKCTLIN